MTLISKESLNVAHAMCVDYCAFYAKNAQMHRDGVARHKAEIERLEQMIEAQHYAISECQHNAEHFEMKSIEMGKAAEELAELLKEVP